MNHLLYIHTGSNIGDRQLNLQTAKKWLSREIGIIHKASKIYETAPWGRTDQPDFLNQALALYTGLSPFEVMECILIIEQQMGRERNEKWAARLIDIDMLFYDQIIIDTPRLKLPHPHLSERNFVLTPLSEIAPNLIHPVLNQTISVLKASLPNPLPVLPV